MEWGEQAHETAKRELKEETGLEAEIGPLLGAQSEWFSESSIRGGKPGHALRLIFQGTNVVGELKRDFSGDATTADAAWFTLKEVNELTRVSVVDFAVRLFSEKVNRPGFVGGSNS